MPDQCFIGLRRVGRIDVWYQFFLQEGRKVFPASGSFRKIAIHHGGITYDVRRS